MPKHALSVPAVAEASSASTIVCEVEAEGIVTDVTYTPTANIAGADDDTRSVSLINKGSDGNGTTVIATLTFEDDVDANDFDEMSIPVTSTALDTKVNDGDILAWVSTAVESGLADPGGYVQVQISGSWPYDYFG